MKRREFFSASGLVTGALYAQAEAAAPESDAEEPAQPRSLVMDPAYIDERIDSRSISAENPTGARGSGGREADGRKGRPSKILAPGDKFVMADIEGPGTIRHFWTVLTVFPPEVARALRLEVFYDGLEKPSVCVPILDFFGLPHGRAAEYYSALICVNEGRGLNSYIPMPFKRSIRMELTNESARHVQFFYQIDYTLEPQPSNGASYLHVTFRRENPTVLRQDFLIVDGLKGPGRFLGCSVGVRLLEKGYWYGEGELKIYRDGDRSFPTYCGTGLEDYVGSAWGLGRHFGPYSGAPINLPTPLPEADPQVPHSPELISFYRWHVPDPIMFTRDLKVAIQQIGIFAFKKDQEADFETFKKTRIAAGPEWLKNPSAGIAALGMYERVDDYCATGFVYCREPQPVKRYETDVATRDMVWQPSEKQAMSEAAQNEREALFVSIKEKWGW